MLILTVRKNFWSSAATMFMLILLIVVWSARGNISTWISNNPSKEVQTERVKRGLQSDTKINSALRQDRMELNADRVLIRQFHDFSDQSSSTPVPSVSVTYVVTAPGVDTPPNATQPQPRTYFSDVTGTIWETPAEPKCVVLRTTDVKNQHYHKMLEESGVAVLYSCPITGIDGEPIGIIMASFLTTEKQRPSDEVIFSTLEGTASRVAGYLADVTAPERNSIFQRILNI